MNILCRLGWHRWGTWSNIFQDKAISLGGYWSYQRKSYVINKQRCSCLRCGAIKERKVVE